MASQEFAYNREDSWKKYPYLYNSNQNLIFECSCGKNYVSFPGLYLHFQRKHQQKISIKQNLGEIEIINLKGKTTHKYFYDGNRINKEENNLENISKNEKEYVESVLWKFVEDFSEVIERHEKPYKSKEKLEQIEHIMKSFMRFLWEKILVFNAKKERNEILESIPSFFNSFVLENAYVPSSLHYQEICHYLLVLSKWMNKHGYSQLILELEGMNQEKI